MTASGQHSTHTVQHCIEALTGRMRVEVICESVQQQQHEACGPVGRAMEPDMVHKMAQMAQIDWRFVRGDKGTLMDTLHATCRPNYCTLERHDSAWTTLQPSHESQTDDDALPSPPVARLAVVLSRAEHALHSSKRHTPSGKSKTSLQRKCTTGARPRSTPTPTPEAFVAVIR
jgi:hypothetical protein